MIQIAFDRMALSAAEQDYQAAMIDSFLKPALAIHNNPGVYALLIGSGVSTAAGIPTGWDITLELIRKIAAVRNEGPEPDPEAWYRVKFGETPEYSNLLDKLTTTPAERMALLRAYFEPTQDERGQGLKVPTPAHRAIATLVKLGYIRLILTTNFDRLIELALEAEGITPDVISSEDSLKGAMPYVHSRCTIIKLHGDYRDTRIKNTAEELREYSPEFNELLDRVLDEFGLVVCGWSAIWDKALRNALFRAPNRRFSTFWLTRGTQTDEATQLVNERQADVIQIESADQAFGKLLESIESLRELERPHPLSTPLAVATVKRYLSEPRYKIQLYDLIRDETEHVYRELISDRLLPSTDALKEKGIVTRMCEYETLTERLMSMIAALAFHDSDDHGDLLTHSIERLANGLQNEGSVVLLDLQYYPALLVSYSAGITSFAAKHFHNLKAILREPRYYEMNRAEKISALQRLNPIAVFAQSADAIPRPREREYTPASNHLFDLLRPIVRDYLPSGTEYEENFDLFEYLLALTYLDIVRGNWSPVGRFRWRYTEQWTGLGDRWERSHLAEFVRVILEQGAESKLLAAGFFNHAPNRFQELVNAHKDWLGDVVRRR